MVADVEGREVHFRTLALEADRAVELALAKGPHRHPQRRGDLALVDARRVSTIDEEEERADDHVEVAAPGDRGEVVEPVHEAPVALEVEPDLLLGLPQRGPQQVLVPGIVPPPGKGHVPGPGIMRMFGALDEKQAGAVVLRGDHHRHGGAGTRFVRREHRRAAAQATLDFQDLFAGHGRGRVGKPEMTLAPNRPSR